MEKNIVDAKPHFRSILVRNGKHSLFFLSHHCISLNLYCFKICFSLGLHNGEIKTFAKKLKIKKVWNQTLYSASGKCTFSSIRTCLKLCIISILHKMSFCSMPRNNQQYERVFLFLRQSVPILSIKISLSHSPFITMQIYIYTYLHLHISISLSIYICVYVQNIQVY